MQAKYALLARGDADIYLRFPPADYNEKVRADDLEDGHHWSS